MKVKVHFENFGVSLNVEREKKSQCKEIKNLRTIFFEPCFLVHPIFSTGNNLPRTESLCDV